MSSASTLVRRLIQEHGPVTTKELYRLSRTVVPSATSAASNAGPTHDASTSSSASPVPSMSFLRKHVLPDIGRSGTFEQIHITKPHSAVPQTSSSSKSKSSSKKQEPTSISAWVWRVTPPERLALQARKAEAVARKSAPPDPLVYDAEKDVLTLAGAPNLEHLNVRRRRTRVQKAQRERALVKEIAALRLTPPQASAQESAAAGAA